MAKVIDARSSDGNLVILGKALVLPSIVDEMVTPVPGSIRYNPPNIEVCNDDDQWVVASGDAVTSESVTTGADPIDADITKSITYITTGGTASDEHINMPNFDFTFPIGDPFSAPEKNGTQHVFVLSTLSDPDDLIHVHPGYTGIAYIFDNIGNVVAAFPDGVPFGSEGQSVTLIWQDWGWMINNMSDMADVQPDDLSHTYLSTPDGLAGNNANNIGIQAGNAETTGSGGGIYIEAGDSSSTGTGGDVRITAGDGGTPGGIFLHAGICQHGATGDGGEIEIQAGTSVAPDGNGGGLFLAAGDSGSGASGNGGPCEFYSGAAASSTGDGGWFDIYAGSGGADGAGGDLGIGGGDGGVTSGAGGRATVRGGVAQGAGDGGAVTLLAGTGGVTSGNGGAVTVTAGNGSGSGDGGDVVITSGTGADDHRGGDVVLHPNAGDGIGRDGLIILQNLPIINPGVSGALWLDGGVLSVSP